MVAIEKTNKEHKINKGNKLMVGSFDVKAEYPSLDITFAATKIAEGFIQISIDWVSRYLPFRPILDFKLHRRRIGEIGTTAPAERTYVGETQI